VVNEVKSHKKQSPSTDGIEPLKTQTSKSRIGMPFVRVPAGRMLMGSPATDKEARPDELPQHPVEMADSFEIGMFEVTIGELRKFVEATGYKTLAERENGGYAFNADTQRLEPTPGSSWKSTGFDQTDDCPVINVAYEDAVAFCDWLSDEDHIKYRLPTEQEWEYACRAGSQSKWSCGDDLESLREHCNLCDQSLEQVYPFATWCVDWNDGFPFTAPAGSFRPNAFGIYDMHGNVFEWCADFWPEAGYDGKKLSDPDEPVQPGSRIVRGGSFLSLTMFTRSADRVGLTPTQRNCIVGFRVVRAGSAPEKSTGDSVSDSSR
jgi:formylglycine-generating enzyme required for sulfatase activity